MMKMKLQKEIPKRKTKIIVVLQVTNEIKLAESGAGTSLSQRYGSADPDLYPYRNVTDP
jgi:hypothetical protein